MDVTVRRAPKGLRGTITLPADKSISHRSVMLAALAQGKSRVKNFLRARDTLATVRCVRALGVNIMDNGEDLIIEGRGLGGFLQPEDILDCENSGTTMRLMSGTLSACSFFSVLTGDSSLRSRPMARVVEPLRLMGARIDGRDGGRLAPLAIRGGNLKGIDYTLPVPSAQVKSAVLLAGLGAEGETVVREKVPSRDHTERMLAGMGAEIFAENGVIRLQPGRELEPFDMSVPADISSAAFWIVAATLVPESEVLIPGVGVNPTRSGVLRVLASMGARIELQNQRVVGGEPVADIRVVSAGNLIGTTVAGEIVPSLIDEIPVLAVAMAMARGESVVRDASELRVKETDRILAVCTCLRQLGVEVEETEDGFYVRGQGRLTGAKVDSYGDHRIAMAMGIAGLVAEGETIVKGAEAVNISYPGFWAELARFAGP
ncbi:MAG TPA: 3-phosphoshikimate 1-carboxyvinyltransferase [Syntrophothermus lipocalidus]|uniref:3-phosphoshikimate 1-carboxyvinyltransferase n=1 Tax=Syntrophothermus sp. TaxID=2736299 RepID=UPI0018370537|nr:3-phosphoshikimate 1-carboxyvinyltransferase [Syntrophothermus sp.]NSW83424.1 3-phosphoshikimate 1-carboxyvinyltransferase [Syntrophothermus sp.]HHV76488.1 3-phosphoshikimate 1-carboxyvinyltransferase [Syntrophothermus lipocalidus]